MFDPEFKALAYQIAKLHCESDWLLDDDLELHPDALDETIALLKGVWNARGAADLKLWERALVCIEAHAEEYPEARPLAADIRRHLETANTDA